MENNNKPTTDSIQRGVDSAGTAVHDSIDKVADPARNTVDRVSTAAHETVDKLTAGASNMADRLTNQTRRMVEGPNKALESSKTWVQEKPLEAVGAALAIGFILGRLTSR